MIGIYKITSPNKKVYIGQSTNIENRFNQYKNIKNSKGQTILNRSFIKYGIDKHKFEILCECSVEELNDKERYYQDVFSVIDKNGLNCKLTKSSDRSGKHSEKTILKISKSNTGKKRTEECKIKLSISAKNRKYSNDFKNKLKNANLEIYKKLLIKSKNRLIEIKLLIKQIKDNFNNEFKDDLEYWEELKKETEKEIKYYLK